MNKTYIFFILLFYLITSSFAIKNETVRHVDDTIVQSIEGVRNDPFTSIMFFFTEIGSYHILLPVTIFISIYYIFRKKWITFIILYINLYGVRWMNEMIKEMVKRERPDFDRLTDISGYSFPSGNTMNSTAVYGLIAYLISTRIKKGKRVVFAVSSILCLLIGLSRIYLGVHYLTDVLAGFAVGLCWLMFILTISEKVRQK